MRKGEVVQLGDWVKFRMGGQEYIGEVHELYRYRKTRMAATTAGYVRIADILERRPGGA